MKSYLDTKLLIYQEKNKQKIHFTASLYQFRTESLFCMVYPHHELFLVRIYFIKMADCRVSLENAFAPFLSNKFLPHFYAVGQLTFFKNTFLLLFPKLLFIFFNIQTILAKYYLATLKISSKFSFLHQNVG